MNNEQSSVKGKGKILAFIGTTPNIGTTVSSLSLAYRIAEITGAKVAYLCLNLKSSKLHKYFSYTPHATLDELLPHLRNASMTEELLRNAMTSFDRDSHVSILLGNRQREMADYFNEDDISSLIMLSRECYDYVILDCNAYWDNAGSLCGLQLSDQIFIVTTNALSHFQEDADKWFKLLSVPLDIESKAIQAIIVRQHKQYIGYSTHEIQRELQLQVTGEVVIPLSLYKSLDEGSLQQWLTHHHEGKNFLLSIAVNILPNYAKGMKSKSYWSWPNKSLAWRKKVKSDLV